jgi:hypothetical protein
MCTSANILAGKPYGKRFEFFIVIKVSMVICTEKMEAVDSSPTTKLMERVNLEGLDIGVIDGIKISHKLTVWEVVNRIELA